MGTCRNRKNEDWNEYDQMDAHELLRYLLDGVSMEEIDVSGADKLLATTKLSTPPLSAH